MVIAGKRPGILLCALSSILLSGGCYQSIDHPSDSTTAGDADGPETSSDADWYDTSPPDSWHDPIPDSTVEADTLDMEGLDAREDEAHCPPEMAYVPTSHVCIDKYEASRGLGDMAVSAPGVMPWAEIGWEDAKLACMLAGKKLCTEQEWDDACRGPDEFEYPYGDTYIEGYCLGDLASPGSPQPTGSYPYCEGGYHGIFDIVGNAAEWVDEIFSDETGWHALTRGGAARMGSPRCDESRWLVPGWETTLIGFRCCMSP
jgi:hypothetical protein